VRITPIAGALAIATNRLREGYGICESKASRALIGVHARNCELKGEAPRRGN